MCIDRHSAYGSTNIIHDHHYYILYDCLLPQLIHEASEQLHGATIVIATNFYLADSAALLSAYTYGSFSASSSYQGNVENCSDCLGSTYIIVDSWTEFHHQWCPLEAVSTYIYFVPVQSYCCMHWIYYYYCQAFFIIFLAHYYSGYGCTCHIYKEISILTPNIFSGICCNQGALAIDRWTPWWLCTAGVPTRCIAVYFFEMQKLIPVNHFNESPTNYSTTSCFSPTIMSDSFCEQ